jgi:2-polyprenyl-6-hydroxyphenyl methylase/3-demethylubiquinone-9 3-methyltransferase
MHPICEPEARCKCCDAAAPLCGVVDLNKNCEIVRRNVLPCCGIPVYYYRCPDCKFIFTTAFDGFTHADFARVIYNDQYVLVDPDYESARPNANAGLLQKLFPASKPARLLDYGGGNGMLARLLAERGFPNVDCYDPHVEQYAQKSPHTYDCIVSFEVFEHTTDPLGLVTALNDLLADPGLVIFSTFLQPPDIDQFGLNWWYAAPRNGHVSLYSRESLVRLTQRFGLQLFSHNQNLHLLVRNPPDFAKHLLQRPPT